MALEGTLDGCDGDVYSVERGEEESASSKGGKHTTKPPAKPAAKKSTVKPKKTPDTPTFAVPLPRTPDPKSPGEARFSALEGRMVRVEKATLRIDTAVSGLKEDFAASTKSLADLITNMMKGDSKQPQAQEQQHTQPTTDNPMETQDAGAGPDPFAPEPETPPPPNPTPTAPTVPAGVDPARVADRPWSARELGVGQILAGKWVVARVANKPRVIGGWVWADPAEESAQGLEMHRVVDTNGASSLVSAEMIADDEEEAEEMRSREGSRKAPRTSAEAGGQKE